MFEGYERLSLVYDQMNVFSCVSCVTVFKWVMGYERDQN